ncbi:MAG: malonic semialdehyde reductase [Deltaproteobacteria bacterium]|nr:malonic semialdehyde reductase [Deltaproteobacteria bacterium]
MTLDPAGLDLLFRTARTYNGWLDQPVAPETLRALYDLAKMPPTSANCQPMRVVFVVSKEAKERLRPCLDKGNVDKTMAAPATAIVAQAVHFHDHMPFLFPAVPRMQAILAAMSPEARDRLAHQGSSMQGAYLMLAARALGLAVGPMNGFDRAAVDAAFFADGACKSNFLCNLGYGDPASLYPRGPRFEFEAACRVQ